MTRKPEGADVTMPRVVRLGGKLIACAIGLLIAYILLFRFTTAPIPTSASQRLQLGFGKVGWTLTAAGKDWKRGNPTLTVVQLIRSEAAFSQDRVSIIWQTWSIYAAGLLLITLFFVGFGCWTSGFALLAKQRSRRKGRN